MANGVTKLADMIVPEIFTPYTVEKTMELTRFLQSGVMVRSEYIDALLAGGGVTFNLPAFTDLDNDDEYVSSDDDSTLSTPHKIGSKKDLAVRLSRNNSWSDMDLVHRLIGADPMMAIQDLVAAYWARRLQKATLATLAGVFADNDAAPAGADTHVQGDLTVDIKGGAYSAGVTDFNAESMIDAATTMGDAQEDLTAIAVHSIVYSRMQKNNLIDFIPDSTGKIKIPTFLGRVVIVDDGMPNAAGVFESYLFGPGVLGFGNGTPDVPTEVDRVPAAGNGGGQDILHNRVEWCVHPYGHAYSGTAPDGGPDNTNAANMLANAASWSRRSKERKMIKLARLITREY